MVCKETQEGFLRVENILENYNNTLDRSLNRDDVKNTSISSNMCLLRHN